MIDTEAIKQNNSLTAIYESLTGNRLRRSGDKMTGLCPFHNDSRSGNFFIYPDNTYHCFACEQDGDLISFVQKLLNKTFEEACLYIDSNIQIRSKEPIKKHFEKPEVISERTKEIYKFFFAILSLTEEGLNYLKGRGLKESIISELQIKSIKDPEAISQKLKQNFSIEELTASGLFGIGKNDKPYFAFYIPCLIFTAFEKNEPVYFCSRNFDQNKRFFKLHNRKQDYFKGDLTKDKIYIFEAIIDAISFYQMTGRNNFIILSGLNYRLYQNIVRAYPDKKIIVAFDNDNAGKKAENEIYIHCGNRPECFDYTAFRNKFGINTTEFKDINDLLKIYELKKGNASVIPSMISSLSELDRERFEERAGIMEFDSGMTRPEAEKNALLNILNEL
jgi:DNA primase